MHVCAAPPAPDNGDGIPKGPQTKGSQWFDLPAQTLDDDTKRELRLIRLRGAYDPKRFYKGFDSTKLPTYFQVLITAASFEDFITAMTGRCPFFQGHVMTSSREQCAVMSHHANELPLYVKTGWDGCQWPCGPLHGAPFQIRGPQHYRYAAAAEG